MDTLATWAAVARTGSFSKAAAELGLPRSSVSRAVARLEQQLDAQLLVRTTRQVSLTAAGRLLYDRVAPLLQQLHAALDDLPERTQLPSGQLRVTAPVDVGVLFLAEVVTRYTARYPETRVFLNLTGRVVDLVAERFDVALRISRNLTDSSLKARKAAAIKLQLFASPLYLSRKGTPRAEDELKSHDWIAFRGNRTPGPARIDCDDLLFMRDALEAGAGLGELPSFVAAAGLKAGTLTRVLPRWERDAGHLYVVTPDAKHVPAKVTAFRELVLELLQ